MKSRAPAGGQPPDTSTWMTRLEVVQFTGIGLSTIPALEQRGLLHPQRVYRADSRGAERSTLVYAPDEVAQLPRRGRPRIDRSDGEQTARAFELFRDGCSDEQVIVELRETVERIQELRQKWETASAACWVLSTVARDALEKLVGPFSSVTELVDRLQVKWKSEPTGSGQA